MSASGGRNARFGGLLVTGALLWGAVPVPAQQTVGLFQNDEASYDGYTLLAPLGYETTYLIDNAGKQIQSWYSPAAPGLQAYLLQDGNLLRAASWAPAGVTRFTTGGAGGRIEEYSWDGTLLWQYDYSDDFKRQHHDIEPMPNGNVLILAWEYRSEADSIAAGRDPALISQGETWPEHIIEVQPVGATGGNIVWEWHVWDHLVQDFDSSKANFGVVADHPELIDINYPTQPGPDWVHNNSVDYNAELDQIIMCNTKFDEIWVIDHSTTTAQTAGHTGGNSGMGGDLLYRWGNPEAYDRGVLNDRRLYNPHNAQWIDPGLPGEDNILIYNNGVGRPGGQYSTVEELAPPVDEFGDYTLPVGQAYGPTDPLWSHGSPGGYYSPTHSGAQRQPNGNTLVCQSQVGTLFEVTAAEAEVWRYVNPVNNNTGPVTQGDPISANRVSRALRYAAAYPAFDGRDLTPGNPIESFTPPVPAPSGASGTTPMTASRLTTAGDEIRVSWDAASCAAAGYNLIFGDLAQVSTYDLTGGHCAVGTPYDWTGVPAGDLFYLVVGVDGTGLYESSWGAASGAERHGATPSNLCGVTTRHNAEQCP